MILYASSRVHLFCNQCVHVSISVSLFFAKASTAAAEVLAQLASDVEEALLKPLVDDLEIFKRVHDKIKERRGIEKEFGHYVQKLGDLRTKVSFRKTSGR